MIRKKGPKAIKVWKEVQNLVVKREQFQKASALYDEQVKALAALDQQLDACKTLQAQAEDPKVNFLQREYAALADRRSYLAELLAELEEKKGAVEGLRAFGFKFVSELYKHIHADNDQPIHELFFHLSNERAKADRETIEADSNFSKLFKTYSKTKNNLDIDAKLAEAQRRLSKGPESIPGFRMGPNRPEATRDSVVFESFEDRIGERNRVVRLALFHQVKRKTKTKDHRQILRQVEAMKGKPEPSVEADESINSDINESVLSDLEGDKPGGRVLKRNFTTLKISFKVDIHNAPTKPDGFFQVRKDRIYRTFHLHEMAFHLAQKAVCGVQLTFLDMEDGTLYVGQMHGVPGDHTQRLSFEKTELIEKIHFAADAREIIHIEFETTLGKHFTVGKSRKEAVGLGLTLVNRYFSDKDSLFSFFAGFNRITRRVAYLRFLFVRKNMLR